MKSEDIETESTGSWSILDHEVPALKETFRCLHSSIGANLESSIEKTHVCFTLTARRLPEHERAAVDIMIALDVSASMSGKKLALCQKTLHQLLRLVSSQDRFGLITYATSSRLELPLTKMTAENKATALEKIRALRTRDATNISSAIGLAFQELRATKVPNAIQTIFLLTDGRANGGIEGVSELETFTKNCAVGGAVRIGDDGFETPIQSNLPPISMHCFGYGMDHHEALLSTISAATSGSYYYIDDDSGVDGAFGDALGGVMSMVAQNVMATFRLAPLAEAQGASIGKILHNQVIKRENGSFSVNVGDFYAEEVRDVIIEVNLQPIDQPQTSIVPHVVGSIEYSDVSQKIPVQGKEHTAFIGRPKGPACSPPDAYVSSQLIRLSTAEALDRAQTKADQGDIQAAHVEVDLARDLIQKSPQQVQRSPVARQLQSDLDFVSGGLRSKVSYKDSGAKLLTLKRRSCHLQRSSETSSDSQAGSIYTTSFKQAYLKKMTLRDTETKEK